MTRPSVGDRATMKSRLLNEQCPTCVYAPGNRMHLAAGRLAGLTAQARNAEGFVVCHSTLRGAAPRGVRPAICRGFYDRFSTQALQLIGRLFGFLVVTPAGQPAASQEVPEPGWMNPGQTWRPRRRPPSPPG